jgi:hypothetical protein
MTENTNTLNNEQDPLAAAMPDEEEQAPQEPQRPMTTNYNKAKAFMDALNALLNIIEAIPELKDGDYVKACKQLKILNDNKNHMVQRIRNTTIVVEQTAIVRRARRQRVRLDDEERIQLGIAERCSKCERVISKRETEECGTSRNLMTHRERDICHNIFSAKRLAIKLGVADVTLYQNIINAIRKWAIKTGKWSPSRRRFYL